MAAQAGIFGFERAAHAQHMQGAGQVARQHFAKAHLALGEEPRCPVHVQGAQRRLPGEERQTQGVGERQQTFALGTAVGLAAEPHGAALALHRKRELPAQVDVHARQGRQNDAWQRIVAVKAEEPGHRSADLAMNRLEGLVNERARIRFLDCGRHEVAEHGQLVLAENGLIRFRQARRVAGLEKALELRLGRRAVGGLLHREAQVGPADADELPVFQGCWLKDLRAVHPRAVHGAGVADIPAAVLVQDFSMPARGVLIIEHDGVIAVPPNGYRPFRPQGADARLSLSGFDRQQRFHRAFRS